MHIHLPKALHGWREVAREMTIIIASVLIALLAEQLVQQWDRKVQAEETAMRFELLGDDDPVRFALPQVRELRQPLQPDVIIALMQVARQQCGSCVHQLPPSWPLGLPRDP
jgi:hypothetical protein